MKSISVPSSSRDDAWLSAIAQMVTRTLQLSIKLLPVNYLGRSHTQTTINYETESFDNNECLCHLFLAPFNDTVYKVAKYFEVVISDLVNYSYGYAACKIKHVGIVNIAGQHNTRHVN